jgi:hypothetical protein
MIPKFGRLGQKMAHSSRKCAIRINAHRYAPPKIYIGDLQHMQTACGLMFRLRNYGIILMTDRLACSNQCIRAYMMTDDNVMHTHHSLCSWTLHFQKKASRGLHMIIFEDITGVAVNYRS